MGSDLRFNFLLTRADLRPGEGVYSYDGSALRGVKMDAMMAFIMATYGRGLRIDSGWCCAADVQSATAKERGALALGARRVSARMRAHFDVPAPHDGSGDQTIIGAPSWLYSRLRNGPLIFISVRKSIITT